MNPRIKELAEKLELPVGLEDPQWAYEPVLEKFAELIVRECVSVMDITDIEDFRGIELALKIKEHFGVEE